MREISAIKSLLLVVSSVVLFFPVDVAKAGNFSGTQNGNTGGGPSIWNRQAYNGTLKNVQGLAPTDEGGGAVTDKQGSQPVKTVSLADVNPKSTMADAQIGLPSQAVKMTWPAGAVEGAKRSMANTDGMLPTNSEMQLYLANFASTLASAVNAPDKQMHSAKANLDAQATEGANGAADLEKQQAASAIDFCASYLNNFTTNAGNKWNQLRNNIFIPMALLLLLPGAVLSQVRAIVAAGSPVLGDVSPFDGIQRAVVAIFLIPCTYLILNYSIDVANSITYSISSEYTRLFGTDMYKDAICAHIRAFPARQPGENRNALDLPTANMTPLLHGNSAFAQFEGKMIENKIEDPAAGIYMAPMDRADEALPAGAIAAKLALNSSNAAMMIAWNILCAFQMVYLYYLWFVGPIAAALWAWPMNQLRGAFPSWVEGVVTLAFWALFWNTTILLMACFRGIDETGTLMLTALNFLATSSVKYAFDFAGLIKAAGQEASSIAEKAMKGAQGGGGGGGGGGAGGHGHGAASHAGRAGASHAHRQSALAAAHGLTNPAGGSMTPQHHEGGLTKVSFGGSGSGSPTGEGVGAGGGGAGCGLLERVSWTPAASSNFHAAKVTGISEPPSSERPNSALGQVDPGSVRSQNGVMNDIATPPLFDASSDETTVRGALLQNASFEVGDTTATGASAPDSQPAASYLPHLAALAQHINGGQHVQQQAGDQMQAHSHVDAQHHTQQQSLNQAQDHLHQHSQTAEQLNAQAAAQAAAQAQERQAAESATVQTPAGGADAAADQQLQNPVDSPVLPVSYTNNQSDETANYDQSNRDYSSSYLDASQLQSASSAYYYDPTSNSFVSADNATYAVGGSPAGDSASVIANGSSELLREAQTGMPIAANDSTAGAVFSANPDNIDNSVNLAPVNFSRDEQPVYTDFTPPAAAAADLGGSTIIGQEPVKLDQPDLTVNADYAFQNNAIVQADPIALPNAAQAELARESQQNNSGQTYAPADYSVTDQSSSQTTYHTPEFAAGEYSVAANSAPPADFAQVAYNAQDTVQPQQVADNYWQVDYSQPAQASDISYSSSDASYQLANSYQQIDGSMSGSNSPVQSDMYVDADYAFQNNAIVQADPMTVPGVAQEQLARESQEYSQTYAPVDYSFPDQSTSQTTYHTPEFAAGEYNVTNQAAQPADFAQVAYNAQDTVQPQQVADNYWQVDYSQPAQASDISYSSSDASYQSANSYQQIDGSMSGSNSPVQSDMYVDADYAFQNNAIVQADPMTVPGMAQEQLARESQEYSQTYAPVDYSVMDQSSSQTTYQAPDMGQTVQPDQISQINQSGQINQADQWVAAAQPADFARVAYSAQDTVQPQQAADNYWQVDYSQPAPASDVSYQSSQSSSFSQSDYELQPSSSFQSGNSVQSDVYVDADYAFQSNAVVQADPSSLGMVNERELSSLADQSTRLESAYQTHNWERQSYDSLVSNYDQSATEICSSDVAEQAVSADQAVVAQQSSSLTEARMAEATRLLDRMNQVLFSTTMATAIAPAAQSQTSESSRAASHTPAAQPPVKAAPGSAAAARRWWPDERSAKPASYAYAAARPENQDDHVREEAPQSIALPAGLELGPPLHSGRLKRPPLKPEMPPMTTDEPAKRTNALSSALGRAATQR